MRLINFKSITFQFTLLIFIFGLISLADHLIFGQDTSSSFYFINIGIIIAVFTLWYFGWKIIKKSSLNYLNLVISGVILFLLIHPTSPWYYVLLTAFITLIFKMFLRYKGSPIFNPANFGLFVSYYITYILKQFGLVKETLFISWWGGDFLRTIWERNILFVVPVLLMIVFGYIAWKFKKTKYVLAFTIAYLAATAVKSFVDHTPGILQSLYTLLVSAFGFLILVMVPEPKTSPVKPKHQIILGIIGGLITFWLAFYLPISWTLISEIDPFVLGLVILNILVFATKYYTSPKPVVRPVVQTPVNAATSTTIQPQITPQTPATNTTQISTT